MLLARCAPAFAACSLCHGDGGGTDYWGEWDDCWLCQGEGETTPEMEIAWYAHLKEIDDAIEREQQAAEEK